MKEQDVNTRTEKRIPISCRNPPVTKTRHGWIIDIKMDLYDVGLKDVGTDSYVSA
jgi:hypothetical protein